MFARKSSKSKGFRGPERDAQSDLQRSEKVLAAMAEALTSIDSETVGLGRRVEELRAWVGGLLGSGDGSDGQRGRQAEAELVAAEHQLMQGLKRLDDIAAIRGRYCDMQAAITAERERALQANPASE